MERKNLYEFYENYLEKRSAYLNKLLQDIKIDDYSADFLLPFNANKFKIKSLNDYKLQNSKQPIMLQRGVFDDKPTASKKRRKTEITFANWFTESMKIENAQEFYKYAKNYPITSTVKNRIVTGKGIKEQYLPITTKKQQQKIYKNEALLRKTMRGDYYLLQMIKYYFNKNSDVKFENIDNITLKDFYQTKLEKNAFKKESEAQSKKQKGDKSRAIFNESYILNKRVPISLLGGKIVGNVALKDSSKYKKLTQNKVIKQLVQYFDKVWNIEEIENEINDYELVRSKELFKTIHKLEQEIYKKAKTENCLNELEDNGIPNFNKYLNYYFIKDNNLKNEFNNIKMKSVKIENVTDELRNLVLLVQIRNKFAHNQLISKDNFEYLTSKFPMEGERVASYLNSIFCMLVEILGNKK